MTHFPFQFPPLPATGGPGGPPGSRGASRSALAGVVVELPPMWRRPATAAALVVVDPCTAFDYLRAEPTLCTIIITEGDEPIALED